MSRRDSEFRREIAGAAQRVLAGTCPVSEFTRLAYNSGDADVDRLSELLEHVPAGDGRCGVGALAVQQYRARISHAIQVLAEG